MVDVDAGFGKFLTFTPYLTGSPTTTYTWEQVGGMDEISDNLPSKDFVHACK
jgi:hypothetical protein